MSKQTTTDFREKISDILHVPIPLDDNWPFTNNTTKIDEILSAVSELVEECLGKPQEPVLEKLGENPSLAEYGAFINHIRNLKLEQIRQRFKERGIEIK